MPGRDRRWARRAQCPRAQQDPRSTRALNGRGNCREGSPGIHAGEDVPVDFQNEAPDFQLLGDGKACVEFVLAFLLSLGCQLTHKATGSGGECLTRHAPDLRLRLAGGTIWRVQCTTCKAVFTGLPHFVLRYRQMRPEGARDA